MRLSIGDNLLVMQSAEIITKPWSYTIINRETSTVLANVSGITADYVLIDLAVGSVYENELGNALSLQILDGLGTVLEEDVLQIAGSYSNLSDLRLLVGLLGENITKESADASDFEDGHAVQQDVTLYTAADLLTALETYDWTRSFVADFTPDHRYHTEKEIQKAT